MHGCLGAGKLSFTVRLLCPRLHLNHDHILGTITLSTHIGRAVTAGSHNCARSLFRSVSWRGKLCVNHGCDFNNTLWDRFTPVQRQMSNSLDTQIQYPRLWRCNDSVCRYSGHDTPAAQNRLCCDAAIEGFWMLGL